MKPLSIEFDLVHELPKRLRFNFRKSFLGPLDSKKLDELFAFTADSRPQVSFNHRTGGLLVEYSGTKKDRERIFEGVKKLDQIPYARSGQPKKDNLQKKKDTLLYKGLLILLRPVLPNFLGALFAPFTLKSYFHEAAIAFSERKFDTRILDFSAILCSFLKKDYRTVSNTSFLLLLGGYLEDLTRHHSHIALSSLLESDNNQVWVLRDGNEVQIDASELKVQDHVVVHAGNFIPVDGKVVSGEASVNQSLMTGEFQAAFKTTGKSVFARTVIEDGQLVIEATAVGCDTKIAKIINIIESSPLYKGELEGRIEQLADKLVPTIFALSALTYFFTGNLNRASSLLLIDYSCALKLATPLALRRAMLDASKQGILIKGGRYLEKLNKFDVVVLDKTGTLTQARPSVCGVYSYHGVSNETVMKIAACLEEHFPHPVATAVTKYAHDLNLLHEEEHTAIKYVMSHGISARIQDEDVLLGSQHFVHDHGEIDISIAQSEINRHGEQGHTLLYLAVAGKLKGLIAIYDPIGPSSKKFIKDLKEIGVKHIVMLTGDGLKTAKAVAQELDIEEYYAEVLPDEKKAIIEKLKKNGSSVVMVGDGMNDSLALASADIGVALHHGADLAKETSHVILLNGELSSLISGRHFAKKALSRISHNNTAILTLNSIFLLLGMMGRLSPSRSSFLHNFSTILVASNSFRPFKMDGLSKV
ncbi:MAG: heavy metal translocating P-type ATPase [Bdellovibrio sp.]|nr:heavy metal translocating P-type ATPase [Bdellovibrio sp.]